MARQIRAAISLNCRWILTQIFKSEAIRLLPLGLVPLSERRARPSSLQASLDAAATPPGGMEHSLLARQVKVTHHIVRV